MNPPNCRHQFEHQSQGPGLPNLWLAQCWRHSAIALGATMWIYSTIAICPSTTCACRQGERFLVVSALAPSGWIQSADVVLCQTQPSPSAALESAQAVLDRLPGCGLAAVPTKAAGILIQTRRDHITVRPSSSCLVVCGICAYPWVATGGRLGDFAGSSGSLLSWGVGVQALAGGDGVDQGL